MTTDIQLLMNFKDYNRPLSINLPSAASAAQEVTPSSLL